MSGVHENWRLSPDRGVGIREQGATIEALTVTMLVSSAMSLCCLAGIRERSLKAWFTGMVMVGGMVLVSLPNVPAPAVFMCAIALAMTGAVLLGRPRRRAELPAMTYHRAFSAFVMSALIFLEVLTEVSLSLSGAHGERTGGEVNHAAGAHASHGGISPVYFLALVSLVAVAVFVVFSVRLIRLELRPATRSALRIAEMSSMVVSTLAMSGMGALMIFMH